MTIIIFSKLFSELYIIEYNGMEKSLIMETVLKTVTGDLAKNAKVTKRMIFKELGQLTLYLRYKKC